MSSAAELIADSLQGGSVLSTGYYPARGRYGKAYIFRCRLPKHDVIMIVDSKTKGCSESYYKMLTVRYVKKHEVDAFRTYETT